MSFSMKNLANPLSCLYMWCIALLLATRAIHTLYVLKFYKAKTPIPSFIIYSLLMVSVLVTETTREISKEV